jgi:pyruvate/2-oxoacid:ferredoxin oxidoreductase alpha subunit
MDTTLQAYLLAETVNLPVMVVLDAFFLSHTFEPVDVPGQAAVDGFLPTFQPKFQLDPAAPCTLYPMAGPAVYMEMRQSLQAAMDRVPAVYARIQDDFAARFGRSYGVVEAFRCDDAEVVLVMAGTTASTCREMVQNLRAQGQRVGLLKLKLFRPFPAEAIHRCLKGVPKVAVVDRNNSAGAGGIFAQELKAALCNRQERPAIYSYVAGLGGRDITTGTLESIYWKTLEAAEPTQDSQWVDVHEELAKS